MSEENGSLSGGGLLTPVDWSYPFSGFNSKDFVHQDSYYNGDDDDEDIDSYYMDLPPIDMTERLKEVNKALAEDSTPVDSDRITKLRFKDVIAEYQSPRESDSDDGYGDSSEIMFDAEDENDIMYHSPPMQDGASTSSQGLGLQEEAKDPLDIKGCEDINSIPDSGNPTQSSTTAEKNVDAISPISAFSSSKIKLVVTPVKEEQRSNFNEEILEEEMVEEVENEEAPHRPFSVNSDRTEGSQGSEEGLKLSDIDGQRQDHSYDEDDDVFEDESEINEEIEEEDQTKDDSSLVTEQLSNSSELNEWKDLPVDTEDSLQMRSNVKHKNKSNDVGESSADVETSVPSVSIKVKDILQNISETDNNENISDYVESNSHINTKNSILGKVKKNVGNKPSANETPAKFLKLKLNKGEKTCLSSSQSIPSIKQSLSPYEISPSILRESRGRKSLSRSLNPAELKQNRSRLNASNLSPTKSPLEAPVQYTRSSREIRARKGSPDPRRSSRFYEKKPVKAVHNQSVPNVNQSSISEFKNPTHCKSVSPHMGVRKAASTSDLCRSLSEDQEKLNKDVYEKWLQQKNRQAVISKRQMEESRSVELAEAATKLQERKRLAEEAFQQWLRRKRDQLRMEKRMKHHQRKLDHHANYARTRTQCDEAYKEWWKRKNEEMNARRVTGNTSVRSRSLERTWIQEKTRKLYNTYLSKH